MEMSLQFMPAFQASIVYLHYPRPYSLGYEILAFQAIYKATGY
jgi:hypothetical protein